MPATRQIMGFPSHPFVSPSINDLVMGEPERLYLLGRRPVPRGTLVLCPHRTLAPRHLPRRMKAEHPGGPQRGAEQQQHSQSPCAREGGPHPAVLPALLQRGTVPLTCPAPLHVLATNVRTAWGQFLTRGRTLALKGKEHRTVGQW